jgi:hypothetical protein
MSLKSIFHKPFKGYCIGCGNTKLILDPNDRHGIYSCANCELHYMLSGFVTLIALAIPVKGVIISDTFILKHPSVKEILLPKCFWSGIDTYSQLIGRLEYLLK